MMRPPEHMASPANTEPSADRPDFEPIPPSDIELARAQAEAGTLTHLGEMLGRTRTAASPDVRATASREALLATRELMEFDPKYAGALAAFEAARQKADSNFVLDTYLEERMGDAPAALAELRPSDSAGVARDQLARRITDVLMSERTLDALDGSIAVGLGSDAILSSYTTETVKLLRAADPKLDAELIAQERALNPTPKTKTLLNDVAAERMLTTMRTRTVGIEKGQATLADFRTGVERQVRNIADEYARAGKKPSPPRPINYGRKQPPFQAAA